MDKERMARAIVDAMVAQNPSLEIVEDGERTTLGVFDDYDNKFYDAREMAETIIVAMRTETPNPSPIGEEG